jgi:MYXO-CTERM domain-containing protein
MKRAFLAAALFFVARPSQAHFVLQSPPSWMSQDSAGSPQKLGPCGDEDDGTAAATPSGTVTAYQVGDTVTITVDEMIFHPGHYRISLAVNDRSELPAEPGVDAGPSYPCGTAVIEDPPVFPVLADNVFPHTAPFTSPQTTTIKLPSNVTCAHCTLQIIEFMSDHGLNTPGGCFYHHCADLAVGVDAGTPPPAADASPGSDAGAEPEPTPSSGCSCDLAPTTTAAPVALALAALALVSARRRRR